MIIGGGTVLITGILHVMPLGGDGMDTIIMLTILVIIMVGILITVDITTITTPDAIMTVAQQRSTEVIALAQSAEHDLQQIVNNDLQQIVRQAQSVAQLQPNAPADNPIRSVKQRLPIEVHAPLLHQASLPAETVTPLNDQQWVAVAEVAHNVLWVALRAEEEGKRR